MPAWGIHLYIAKKLKDKIKIDDYNSFLLGNVIPDINNGYLVKDVSKVISHRQTHYCYEYKIARDGKPMYYDIEQFIEDNKSNLNDSLVLGFLIHILTDKYWNNLTYEKHGIYNKDNELIGLTLNNGVEFITDADTRRQLKQNDFKIYADYIYKNKLADIPIFEKNAMDSINKIKVVKLTDEDVIKATKYLDSVKDGMKLEETQYKIFTENEMEEETNKCIDKIVTYYEEKIK